ncbi:hypothetical protein [Streptacidiphilus sp. EB103A]|uniref:hypothetical protein n=1 Tax=Streptacidiphilus sp. EB103A TaxID=3156275 RepID=UPI003516E161
MVTVHMSDQDKTLLGALGAHRVLHEAQHGVNCADCAQDLAREQHVNAVVAEASGPRWLVRLTHPACTPPAALDRLDPSRSAIAVARPA